MLRRASRQLRSWMIIYAGLVAAILLADQPPDADMLASEIAPQPILSTIAPLSRRDI